MKTKDPWFYPIAIIGLLLTFTFGCKKDEPVESPTLTTLPVTEITTTSATSGGNITHDGGATVTSRGIVWSTSENPTNINNDGKTTDGEGTEGFTSNLTNLSSGITYFVSAYATNSSGTSYGNQIEFTTEVLFAGGTGTMADPYLIETSEQLDSVRHNLNKHFRQIADIDLSGYSSGEGWQPIGDEKKPFSGTFDGNGHKISNLTIDRPNMYYVGLFGMTEKSSIKNTGLVIIKIKGKFRVGGLVGENHNGNITGSYTTGDVSGNDVVGGLVGLNIEADIINCYATGNVSGNTEIGGLVGQNWQGIIQNSFAAGNVLGENHVGGLVGFNDGNVTKSYATGDISGVAWVGGLVGQNLADITNCYATGNVSGSVALGGFVGRNYGIVTDSYATGNVSGNTEIGGLAGQNWQGIIQNSFAAGNVLGENHVGGLVGSNPWESSEGIIEYSYYDKETTEQEDTGKGIPKTIVEMMQQSTFESWDFTSIWRINEGNSYPYLRWQE